LKKNIDNTKIDINIEIKGEIELNRRVSFVVTFPGEILPYFGFFTTPVNHLDLDFEDQYIVFFGECRSKAKEQLTNQGLRSSFSRCGDNFYFDILNIQILKRVK
jgi:hypothetical protein